MRRRIISLALAIAGCVDGTALREAVRGDPTALSDMTPDTGPIDGGPMDAGPDARVLDGGAIDARLPTGDARVRDALVDMAPDPDCVPETCNDLDDDCDGSVDEGVADCCVPGTQRDCGTALGECTLGEQFCTVDLQWSPCSADPPGVEMCDGALDEDCDGRVDEGITNACGACGDVPAERCDGADNDCDGEIDEGTLNACRTCGPVPREVCNQRDDDCDGQIDEGVRNACGECGAAPTETCDGDDDDCDGRIDEDACYAFILDDADGAWRAPPGLNAGAAVIGRDVSAAFATVRGGDMLWAVVGNTLHAYDIERDRWLGEQVRDAFRVQRVEAAYAVPAWWGGDPLEPHASVTVTRGENYEIVEFDPVTRDIEFVREGSNVESWSEDRAAPRSFPLRAAVLDLFDNADYWPGDVAETCGAGRPGPVAGIVTAGRLFTADSGTCFRFMDERPLGAWSGFRRANAPPVDNLVAWAYVNRPNRTGMHIIILDRPEDGR